jgi:Kelch motif/Galactose oxidase, central domain
MRVDTIVPMTIRRFFAPLVILVISLYLTACGGGGGSGAGLTITPKTATVAAGASLQFSAVLSGVADQTINWSVTGGGSVTPTGLFTAPSAPTTVTVTAASNAAPSLTASATVTVVALAPAGGGGGYSGVFTNLSSMKNARNNHTATFLPTTVTTALPNGYLLVAGGIGSGGAAIDKAELFNPAARAFGHFSSVGSMTTTRAYHTATGLQNGKVLVVGGVNSNNTPLTSAEIYDPASKTFTATGSMSTGRWLHTATLLANGKVLIAGGNADPGPGTDGGNALGSCELYDPVKGTFTTITATMVNPRYYHTATLLASGKVLLAGGQGTAGQILPDTEIYDPVANSFTATGSMLVDPAVDTGRWLHSATLLGDGTAVVVGGDAGTIAAVGANYLATAQVYDPLTAAFTPTAGELTDARGLHAGSTLATGQVLLTGGIGFNVVAGGLSDFLNSAELYDPAGRTFAVNAATMNAKRANLTANALPDGRVVVIGGNDAGGALKSAEFYH